MSYEIKFDGYVTEVKNFTWGVTAKVIHSVRALNAKGEWETASKEYVDCVFAVGTVIEENTRVTVTGKASKLGAYLSKDGTPKATLKISNATFTPIVGNVTPISTEPDLLPF
jgi:hypothetical protein